MAIVSAETLAVDGVPDVGLAVLGAGEEEISLSVVFDLSDRLLVTVQTDWLHLCDQELKLEFQYLHYL